MPTPHLLTVWNPSYATDAMEAHLAILLGWAARHDKGDADDEDLYVWWGKVRSQNRQAPQANLDEIRAIGRALEARDAAGATETHVYLTDYRSLYVGELLQVVERDLDERERAHVPDYYEAEGHRCDFWFRLGDIRRLVHDDLPAVVAELKQLSNTHYNGRPVSLYGGMVDLPLIVTRADGTRFFDADERDELLEGKLWVEHDASSGSGTAAIERALREDLLGDAAWSRLELAARTSIATGEKLFREQRTDPSFDFGTVIVSFSKAIEIQCRALLRRVLPSLPRDARLANIDGRTVDLLEHTRFTAGQLARAFATERGLYTALNTALDHGKWFTGQLPSIIGGLLEVRNPGVHEARVDRRTATHWRNRLLGVGCTGDFVELAKVVPKR
jgi:hypothetical protein